MVCVVEDIISESDLFLPAAMAAMKQKPETMNVLIGPTLMEWALQVNGIHYIRIHCVRFHGKPLAGHLLGRFLRRKYIVDVSMAANRNWRIINGIKQYRQCA